MISQKTHIIQDYDKLDKELRVKVKLFYPDGFKSSIIKYTDKTRKKVNAIRFETTDKIYLLRLSNKMVTRIMEEENEVSNMYF